MGNGLAIVIRRKYAPPVVAASAFLLFGLNSTTSSAFPGLVMEYGGSVLLAGAVNSLFILIAIVLRFPFEPLSTRIGCAWMLRIGAAGYFLPCIPLALCSNLYAAIAIHMVQAIGLAAFQPGVSQYLAATSNKQSLGRHLGLLRFATTASLMVGPVLLFPLINGINFTYFFMTLALAGLAGFTLTAFLPSPHKHRPSTKSTANGTPTQPPLSSYLQSCGPYTVALLLVGPFLLAGGYSVLLSFGQTFSQAQLSGFNDGVLFTWISVGGLAGSLISGRITDRISPKVACCLNIAANATGLLLLAFAPYPALIFMAAALCGLGYFGATTSFVAAASLATGKVASGEANPFLSRQQSALDSGMIIGSAAAGLMLQWGYSFVWVFTIAAIMVLVCLPGWVLRYPKANNS